MRDSRSAGRKCRIIQSRDAYPLVLLKLVPGALHIDVFVGRKLCADPIIGGGTSLDVLLLLSLKDSFKILTNKTAHAALPSSACPTVKALAGEQLW